MKKILKILLPMWFLRRMNLFRHYMYDLNRYRKSASTFKRNRSKINLESNITRLYHAIEKGLSHNKIRLGFGIRNLELLHGLLLQYKEKYNVSNFRFITAISVVNKYIQLHDLHNYNISSIKELYSDLLMYSKKSLGGIYELNRNEILNLSQGSYKDFFNSRFSVRDFSNESVDIEVINKALELARKTPSVCNRQDWGIIVIKDKKLIDSTLSIQNGFNGFTSNINTLICVLSNSSYLDGVEERNQGYIDGGLFTMSLVNSFHYYKLATCVLNACFPITRERKVRELLSIDINFNLISFIAVGKYMNNFSVPVSQRDEIGNYVKYL